MAKSGTDAQTAESMTMEELQAKIAKLEGLLGKTETSATVQAENPDITENEKRMQELVEIRLFKDTGKYKDDVFVAVNGKAWQIRRGETVKVPRFVKEVLDSSLSQDQYAAKYAEGLADTYEKSRQRV